MCNPYVLTRPYWHLTFVVLIELHWIMCFTYNNIIRIQFVGFGDNARVCKMDKPWVYKLSETTNLLPFNKVSRLFDNLSAYQSPLSGSELFMYGFTIKIKMLVSAKTLPAGFLKELAFTKHLLIYLLPQTKAFNCGLNMS